MKIRLVLVFIICSLYLCHAQDDDDAIISNIYKNALSSYDAYNHLKALCENTKGRMVGSSEAEKAVEMLTDQIKKTTIDTVYRQNYYTSSWYCKSAGQAIAIYDGKRDTLNVAALGMSVSTEKKGVTGELLEVFSLDELDSLGYDVVKDKIVFFNRAMDNSLINTFVSYRGAIDQRTFGAIKSSEYGAKGVIIRSLGTEPDDYPHTGVSRYKDGVAKIPILSVSTNDAEKLSRIIKNYQDAKLWISCNTVMIDSLKTCNLVAEIKGTKYPDQIILIGAHIDAWHNTEGANDDGAGCVQMIDILRIFNELNVKPEHTIRLILFMDEEINQSGADEYARYAGQENKEHIAAIESDAGGLLPIGFAIDAEDSIVSIIQKYTASLGSNGINTTIKGFAGVDISRLAKYHVPLIGLMTNSQRYFEFHHSGNDTFDKVSRREMQLGTASVACLVYLIDKYGMQ